VFAAAATTSVFGLTFDHTIDAGAFLTFVTLAVGFLGWAYKTIKEWRRDAQREAENGALRLLLKILRERYQRDAGPVALDDLRAEYERPERVLERKAYCGRDFHYKDGPHFERAIYQLQWEFKIDFAAGDEVLFRTSAPSLANSTRLDVSVDRDLAMSCFTDALAQDDVQFWDLERLGRLAARVDPPAATDAITNAIGQAAGNPRRTRELLALAETLRR
jgi:hypothetical protein